MGTVGVGEAKLLSVMIGRGGGGGDDVIVDVSWVCGIGVFEDWFVITVDLTLGGVQGIVDVPVGLVSGWLVVMYGERGVDEA